MDRIELETSDEVTLAGVVSGSARPEGGAAVLCHPHPQYGGSKESWLMPVLERALVDDGWLVVRFDFRGAGDSGGTFGGGDLELQDVAAAARWAREAAGETALLVGGWSFGAHVALRHVLGDGDGAAGWFGIGLPYEPEAFELPKIDVTSLETSVGTRKLFLHGSRDQFTPVERIAALVDRAAEPKELRIIEGADHFLAAHGDVLAAAVRDFARECLPDET